MIYLDTHVVVWLYAGDLSLFPEKIITILETTDLVISPIILLELKYLQEIKKIKKGPDTIFNELDKSVGLKVTSQDFKKIVEEATKQSWTRDPFDRIIVAEASLTGSKILTKDRSILDNYSKAVWL